MQGHRRPGRGWGKGKRSKDPMDAGPSREPFLGSNPRPRCMACTGDRRLGVQLVSVPQRRQGPCGKDKSGEDEVNSDVFAGTGQCVGAARRIGTGVGSMRNEVGADCCLV
jgi:hypothetical protein